jgi:hypothetical protein
MNRDQFQTLAKRIADTAGPLDTVVVACINVNRGEMVRLSARPSGPDLAILARSLLVDALEMMEEASDDTSMALANAIEAAIGCLPPNGIDEEADEL